MSIAASEFFAAPLARSVLSLATAETPSGMAWLPTEWHEWVGLAGAATILIAYAATQLDLIKAQSFAFTIPNLVGSLLVCVSLKYNFNLPALLIEVCWAIVSAVGIIRLLAVRQRE